MIDLCTCGHPDFDHHPTTGSCVAPTCTCVRFNGRGAIETTEFKPRTGPYPTLPGDFRREIVEHGITRIEIQASDTWNREYCPAGQTAKWFRDDLDQLWVKFSEAPAGASQRVIQHVIPASRVVEVQYEK